MFLTRGHKAPQPDSVWDLVGPYLPQQVATPIQSIADALGITTYLAENLLGCRPTIQVLLELHRLAQYQELALARRLWPQCTRYGDSPLPWLQSSLPPEVVIVLRAFGAPLLDHVWDIDRDTAVDYVHRFQLPPEYQIAVPGSALSPAQIVHNPYAPDETFAFDDPATARCFEWLIADPQQYGYYLDSKSSVIEDPIGIQEAYLLRCTVIKHYFAPLPPDTLPTYLALADALTLASVPREVEDGSVAPLSIVRAGQSSSPTLQLLQENDGIWRSGPVLAFDHSPVNVFVLIARPYPSDALAAVILTTAEEPGDPEKYRQSGTHFDLPDSEAASMLAIIPTPAPGVPPDVTCLKPLRARCERASYGYVQDETTQHWCFCLEYLQDVIGDPDLSKPITVYAVQNAYLLRFVPSCTFAPNQMAAEGD